MYCSGLIDCQMQSLVQIQMKKGIWVIKTDYWQCATLCARIFIANLAAHFCEEEELPYDRSLEELAYSRSLGRATYTFD